jgi:integrase
VATIIKSDNPKARKPYTVRFRDSLGVQREKSWKTKREAETFANDQERAKRYGTDVNLTAQKHSFNDAVEKHLGRLKEGRTRDDYVSAYNAWVKDAYAGKSVKEAAYDYSKADQLLNFGELSKRHKVMRSRVRTLLVRTLDMLVKEDVIQSHKISTVELAEIEYVSTRSTGFVEITAEDAEYLAEQCGLWVTLQYRLGLRISEALGLHREDFVENINGGATLHLTRQAARGGKTRVALKAKGLTDFRDVPVPADVWEKIKGLPEGPLFTGRKNPYYGYCAAQEKFKREAEKIGFANLGTHQLRHAFATRMIQRGMSIVMLAKVLGHASTEITFKTYIHVMPSDLETAAELMAA